MNRVLLLFILILGAFTLEGVPQPIVDANPIHEAFITPVRDPGPVATVATPPPAPIFESIPARPYDDATWIPGYWAWSDVKNDFIWICGVWRRPPPEHIWIPGSWVPAQGSYAWQSGFWSLIPEEQLAYIQKTPPPQANEQVPPAPGDNYFWIKGYWEYQPQTNSFTWLSGRWQVIDPNWILSPSSYVWRQSGFVFVPLLWDYILEERGEAYTCTGSLGSPLVIIEPSVIIEQLYFCYPDYIHIYWHWGVIHPGWWDGCDCLPPWWSWGDWWTFPWGDLWGLWWWWGHPGFPAPIWMNSLLSMELAPPSPHLLALFSKVKKPLFDFKPGSEKLVPKGPKEGGKKLPKPTLPDVVKPGGSITLPPAPGRFVTPPEMPQPQGQGKGPGGQDWGPPGQQVNPEPVNPNWETPPPTYIPPRVWIPPRDRGPYPDRHDHDDDNDRPGKRPWPGRGDDDDDDRPGKRPWPGRGDDDDDRWPGKRPQGDKTPPGKNPQGRTPPQGGSSDDIKRPEWKWPSRQVPPQSGKSPGSTAPPQRDRSPSYTPPQGGGSNSRAVQSQGNPRGQASPKLQRVLPELAPRIQERIQQRQDNRQQDKKGN